MHNKLVVHIYIFNNCNQKNQKCIPKNRALSLSFSGVKSSNINGWLASPSIKPSSSKQVMQILKDFIVLSE